jgi:cell division septum initiation protein DivIVA
MATLGQQISELIDQERKLRDATTDPQEKEKLRARIEDLDEQLEDLIDRSWPTTTDQYQRAIAALGEASAAANKARKGLAKVDEVVGVIDQAIGAIATLIASV